MEKRKRVKLKEIKVSDIVPYAKNARKNDRTVEQIVDSIEEYGYVCPIVVDGDNVVLAGHARLKALKKMGVESVQVVVADHLTGGLGREYRLVDNKARESTKWDFGMLVSELRSFEDKGAVEKYFPEFSKFLSVSDAEVSFEKAVDDGGFSSERDTERFQGSVERAKGRFYDVECPHCGKSFKSTLRNRLINEKFI